VRFFLLLRQNSLISNQDKMIQTNSSLLGTMISPGNDEEITEGGY
jgi:hypothetical protein